MRELGVALGPAIGWVEEGVRSIDDRPIVSLQTVFNMLEQEPGLTFAAASRACRSGDVSLISRVPHASDTLSGKVTPDTVFPTGDHRAHRNRDNMLDNFEKAETLVVPLGRRPAARSVRPRSPASSPTPRSRSRAAHRAVGRRGAASTRPHPTCRSRPTRPRRSTTLSARNFDHVDRYVMPLKSSV